MRVGRDLHRLFEASLALKTLFAAGEMALGLAVWLVPSGQIADLTRRLTAHELTEDPTDRLAHLAMSLSAGITGSGQAFWAAYLVSHAAIKLAVLAGLYLRIRWAYPVAMVVLAGFAAYQMHRWTLSHAPSMIALTVFDLLVIALTWREYRTLPVR